MSNLKEFARQRKLDMLRSRLNEVTRAFLASPEGSEQERVWADLLEKLARSYNRQSSKYQREGGSE